MALASWEGTNSNEFNLKFRTTVQLRWQQVREELTNRGFTEGHIWVVWDEGRYFKK